MHKIMKVLITLIILAIWWWIGTLMKYLEDKKKVKELREYADEVKKPILNLGCGRTNWGDVNADVQKKKNIKGYVFLNAEEKLPYSDGHFSSVIASNIIEHLTNPKKSLKEMERVADKVYVGYPKWWQLGTWLTPDHKWLVFKNDIYRFVRYYPLWAYIFIGLILLWW